MRTELKRTGISFSDPDLLKAAQRKAEGDGFRSFSAYVESLIRADTAASEIDPALLTAVMLLVKKELAATLKPASKSPSRDKKE